MGQIRDIVQRGAKTCTSVLVFKIFNVHIEMLMYRSVSYPYTIWIQSGREHKKSTR